MKRTLEAWVFALPCLFLVIVIVFYPLFNGVVNSFRNIDLMANITPRFVGLANFIRLFKDPLFWSSLGKSITWTITIVISTMVIGFGIAVLLNQKIKGKRIFRV